MFIPDHKVEEIRAASDVVDVVSDYVRLKKRGSNYFGLCPFHNEKTPSFSVNPSMGIYKCFGCSKGGNVFQFVMEMESIGFPEAVRMLAERAGIPLPEQDAEREQAGEIESIYHALRFAARFFYDQLTQTEAGRPALDYLTGRGFVPKTIKNFGLGFAPDRWDALLKEAERNHIEPDMLEKAGLVLPRKEGDGYYDRFRGRAIFPILSHVGKVLGFGGRIMASGSDQPKYINSPETKVYNKSRALYGLFQAKQAIRKSGEVILVEGYTDVISMHQAGVENVVASSGTALTIEQVKMLGRYAQRPSVLNILLLYDADTAGADAALRGIDLVLSQGHSAYAIALPDGEDPDSFVREHGGETFREYARKHRQDFVTFIYGLARRRGRLDTPEGQAETMHAILASVAKIPDPLMQETFMRRASDVLDVPDMQLRPVLTRLLKEKKQKVQRDARREQMAAAPPTPESPPDRFAADDEAPISETAAPALPEPEVLPQEKTLLRLMLEDGAPMIEYILGHMALEEFTQGPPREIVEILLQMYHEEAIDAQRFFEGSLDEAVQGLVAEVLVDRYEPSENWASKKIHVPRINEDPHKAATSAMTLLKLNRVNDAIAQHKEKMYRAAQNGGDQHALQTEMMHLLELKKQIKRGAFLTWNQGTPDA